jgi:chemotaxis response regulator CheB
LASARKDATMKVADPVGSPEVIVIGASAGGVEALITLVREPLSTDPLLLMEAR